MFNREVSKIIAIGLFMSLSSISYAASTGKTPITSSISISNDVGDWMILDPADDTSFIRELGFDASSDISKSPSSGRDGNDLASGDERYTGSTTFQGRMEGSTGDATNVMDFVWDLQINADPFIDGIFTITNLTGMDQTYSLSFGIPVTPSFNDGIETGFLGLSIEDTNGDGSAEAILTEWNGTINGAVEMQLFASSLLCLGANCNGAITPSNGGPENYTGPVDTIGIEMEFILSAGDSITVNTRYEVNPVPIPAAVWLFGSSLFALIGLSKRQ